MSDIPYDAVLELMVYFIYYIKSRYLYNQKSDTGLVVITVTRATSWL